MRSRGEGWIDVETSKRSYSARGDARVTWQRGERVVSIKPHDDDDDDDDDEWDSEDSNRHQDRVEAGLEPEED